MPAKRHNGIRTKYWKLGVKMDGTKLIKVLLAKRGVNALELSKKLKCSSANIYNKFKRNNFSLNELEEIADVLDCNLIVEFEDKNTKEII